MKINKVSACCLTWVLPVDTASLARSTTNGMPAKVTPLCTWPEQEIIEWAWRLIAIVVCCHSVKLSALAVRALRSQHWKASHKVSETRYPQSVFRCSSHISCIDDQVYAEGDPSYKTSTFGQLGASYPSDLNVASLGGFSLADMKTLATLSSTNDCKPSSGIQRSVRLVSWNDFCNSQTDMLLTAATVKHP